MALINTEKQFIFFHLFKCAGSSMRQILTTNTYFCHEYQGVHSSPKDTKCNLYEEGNEDLFKEYFKFTIIRNPFDWLVSIYFYLMNYPEHEDYKKIVGMSLKEFIEYYVNHMVLNKGKGVGANKNTTLFDYVTDKDGNILVDYIGRYETIHEDMKNILGKVGIKHIDLPNVNVNPSRERDYRKHYDEETISMVEKYFKKDLEYFNYKF